MRSIAKTLTESYPALPGSIRQARQRLSDFAAAAGADQDRIEAVRLAASEALTNAVLHAYRGNPGRIHVTAAVVEGELWVLIADDGCGLEPAPDRPGLGLGLVLIAQLSDHLAIAPRAHGGTEVRMRFNLVGALTTAGDSRAARESHRRPLGRGRARPGGLQPLSGRHDRGSDAAARSPAAANFSTTT